MKNSTGIAIFVATFLSLVTPVFAETAARQDDSNILVWAFLGACALIIFLQLVPVVSMAFALIKGASSSKDVEMEPAPSKYQ